MAMAARQRREQIRKILASAKGPVSASALAATLSVSRQIVVGDIALLRAGGCAIDATPRGYVMHTQTQQGYTGLLACIHSTAEQLKNELYIVVDNGGCMETVSIENPLYGEISGTLHVASRYDANVFLQRAAEQPDGLLSRMTGGVHLHMVRCPDEETFRRIEAELDKAGLLYKKE